MEHLDSIARPVTPHPEVPYLLDNLLQYDDLGLQDFPSRIGFDPKTPDHKRNLLSSTAIFQASVYFAPLRVLYGIWSVPFTIDNYIRRSTDGRLLIDTSPLRSFLSQWARIEFKDREFKEEAGRISRRSSVIDVLYFVNRSLNTYEERKIQLMDPVWDATLVLWRAICNAASVIYRRRSVDKADVKFIYRLEQCALDKFRLRLLDARFEVAAWCPREQRITRLECNNDQCLMYACCQIDRRGDAAAHQSCTENMCQAYQINEATYQTQHWPDTCAKDCEMIGGVAEEASVIYEKAQSSFSSKFVTKVPTITFQDGEVKIKAITLAGATMNSVVRNHPNRYLSCYVAISHVWADGMGNPHENKLPACQLGRLQILVNQLFPPRMWPVPFWIDTLLVPLDKTHRRLAISMMNTIYSSANKVLVLDKSLMQTSTFDMNATELGLRIITSGWSRRLWTLQEGAHQGAINFQFKDKKLNYKKFKRMLYLPNKMPEADRWYRSSSSNSRRPASILDSDDEGEMSEVASMISRSSGVLISPTNASEATSFGALLQERGDGDDTSDSDDDTISNDDSFHARAINPCGCAVIQRLKEWNVTYHAAYTRGWRIDVVSRIIMHRTTSKLEDESVCFINLISKTWFKRDPPKKLLQVSSGERYRALFQSMSMVPHGLLFLDQERYPEPHSRWIPKSFLSQRSPRCVPVRMIDMNESTDFIDINFGRKRESLDVVYPAFILDDTLPTKEHECLPANCYFRLDKRLFKAEIHDAGAMKLTQELKGELVLLSRDEIFSPEVDACVGAIVERDEEESKKKQLFDSVAQFRALVRLKRVPESEGVEEAELKPLFETTFTENTQGQHHFWWRII